MNIPWGLILWSVVGVFALRPVFTDDVEYPVACLVYAMVLGFVSALLEIKHDE